MERKLERNSIHSIEIFSCSSSNYISFTNITLIFNPWFHCSQLGYQSQLCLRLFWFAWSRFYFGKLGDKKHCQMSVPWNKRTRTWAIDNGTSGFRHWTVAPTFSNQMQNHVSRTLLRLHMLSWNWSYNNIWMPICLICTQL